MSKSYNKLLLQTAFPLIGLRMAIAIVAQSEFRVRVKTIEAQE